MAAKQAQHGAEWITNIAADNGTSDAFSITGENDAFITITTTTNPNDAERNTTLTLRAIDQAGKALTDPAPVTILFTRVLTTHTGDVSVTTQAEVDALRTSLTVGATRIVGNVIIGLEKGEGTSDISDLSPLAAITEVTGNVVVRHNPDLTNLMGLNQLQTIGGRFSVSSNVALTSLGDFPDLQTIGDSFVVWYNDALTSLGDFTALQTIGGGFSMYSDALTSLGDFPVLQTIGGSFGVGGGAFTSLGDFPALQSIGDKFVVSSNASLTSLGNFSILQSIGGSFCMSNNASLTSLGGFPMLESIGTSWTFVPSTGRDLHDISIVVEENERLQDCCVLTTFLSGGTNAVSGQIFINNNAPGCNTTTQVDCDPFLQVGQKVVFATKTTSEGTLEIFSRGHWQLSKPNTGAEWITNIAAGGGNSDASSITGENNAFITITTTANPNDAGRSTTLTLRAIDQTGNVLTEPASITIPFTQLGTARVGDVTLYSQADVNALVLPANATAIHGNVRIGSLASDISDLSPLTAITEITGNVLVQNNSGLPNLMGLNQLQTIGGYFKVSSNATLTSLGDFPTLQSIGGDFEVSNNALTSLGDFPTLQSIGGRFVVFNNALTSLGDFPTLQSIGGRFVVSSNVALPSLGDFSTLQTIGGSFEVKNNGILTSLGDFPALQTIGGSFSAQGNDALTSLGGFPMLASIGSDQHSVSISVASNNRLQDCCVLTPFLSGATNVVSGKVFINENAIGCNSTTEVNCDPFLQVGQKVVFVAKTAGEGTLEIFSTLRWQLSKPNTGAEWITNMTADNGTSDASSITGKNDAFITITTTANPNDAGRSTTLTLRAIDQTGNALTDPASVTIPFTQLGITTGSITLASQADVNAFPANVTAIQGDLIIGSSSDITNLRPLSGITHVTGRVEVVRNDRLVSLGFLGNLQAIGGSFRVEGNNLLQDCCVLTAFLRGATNAVSGRISIYDNAPGCDKVNCDSFLQVGKKVVFATKTAGEGTLGIFSRQHWQLSKPNTGAEWITNIAADGGNSDASSITGENHAFITIMTVANPTDAVRSTTLTLRAIDQAGNALTDPMPITIPFTQLGTTHTGDTMLKSQADVNAFSANVTAIQGDLIIGNRNRNLNSDITDLRPLSGITHVTGRVEVVNNDRLVSLGSLGNLQAIDRSFNVKGNVALTSMGDFPTLQTIGGGFRVYRNEALTSMGDFPALQTIGGGFSVSNNDVLPSMGDFLALQTIGGSFEVSDNDALTSLGDFTVLQSIKGIFYVEGNATLISLGRFPMLASIGSADGIDIPSTYSRYDDGYRDNVSIVVEANDRLQDCCVLTAFLSGATNAVPGEIFIDDNATGCSSEGEIKPCVGGGSTIKGK